MFKRLYIFELRTGSSLYSIERLARTVGNKMYIEIDTQALRLIHGPCFAEVYETHKACDSPVDEETSLSGFTIDSQAGEFDSSRIPFRSCL